MNRVFVFACLTVALCVSCSSTGAYRPATEPEKIEYSKIRYDVYPNDVRANISRYTNTPVAWPGIIFSTGAWEEDIGGKIRADTVLDHHYYDWKKSEHPEFKLSSRGEGRFRIHWFLKKKDPDAGAPEAESYAGKGQLGIVYGVPESVEPDGTIVLRYHYIRVLREKFFSTNQMDYGRLGELDPPKLRVVPAAH
jgi:hypothetical protein